MKEKMPAYGWSAEGRKIAIISDVHDNKANLKKVLDYCAKEKIQTIICCGDLASAGTLDFLNDNFSGNIHFTFGNADWEWEPKYASLGKYKKTLIYKDFGETEIESRKVALSIIPIKPKNYVGRGNIISFFTATLINHGKKISEIAKY
jgi:putative phosphoesterase